MNSKIYNSLSIYRNSVFAVLNFSLSLSFTTLFRALGQNYFPAGSQPKFCFFSSSFLLRYQWMDGMDTCQIIRNCAFKKVYIYLSTRKNVEFSEIVGYRIHIFFCYLSLETRVFLNFSLLFSFVVPEEKKPSATHIHYSYVMPKLHTTHESLVDTFFNIKTMVRKEKTKSRYVHLEWKRQTKLYKKNSLL